MTTITDPTMSVRQPRVRTWVRARLVLAVAAVAALGITVHHVNQPSEPESEAMTAIPTPCDDFMDCVYTAWWYAFLR
jgi:hypothetical protein